MSNNNDEVHRGWEYAQSGDYHRNLDLNWSYAPTYLRKMRAVRRFVNALPINAQIADLGCGEGVIAEEFAAQGRAIIGFDLNYESQWVRRGDLLDLPIESDSLDAVLLLDVFEHLQFKDQRPALQEIYRVLKPNGQLLASIPNLAHWNTRFLMAKCGRLDRTDSELNHVGERPFLENLELLQEAGFKVYRSQGITLTVPYLYRLVICRQPARFRKLHDLLEPYARRHPALAMLTMFYCRKPA